MTLEIPTQCTTPESKLVFLASLLSSTKRSEEHEKKERIKIEEQIAALIPGPEKGSKTVTLPNGTKLTVERGFNYKANTQEIGRIFLDELIADPPPLKQKTTVELDSAGYEWFRENRPGIFSEISQHVTVTPKKVAVSIKAKE